MALARATASSSGGAGHHQAGGGQDAVAMGALDRLVDFDGGAEVVGGDDQLLHISPKNAWPA